MPTKDEEDFEVVPLSPVRRLEKRIEKLESSPDFDMKDFFHELIAIIRMNQEIVDQLAKANDSLRIELAKLPAKIDELNKNLTELLTYIKAAAMEEATGVSPETFKPLTEKIDQLIKTNEKIAVSNEDVTSLLALIEKKLKPSPPPRPFYPRPPLVRQQ